MKPIIIKSHVIQNAYFRHNVERARWIVQISPTANSKKRLSLLCLGLHAVHPFGHFNTHIPILKKWFCYIARFGAPPFGENKLHHIRTHTCTHSYSGHIQFTNIIEAREYCDVLRRPRQARGNPAKITRHIH